MKDEFETSRTILLAYESFFRSLGVRPVRNTDEPASLGHCMWMCHESIAKIESGLSDIAKVNRWIGWIQCALVNADIFSLDDCRAHSSSSEVGLGQVRI